MRPVVNGFHQSIHTTVSEVEGHIGVGQDGLLWQEAPEEDILRHFNVLWLLHPHDDPLGQSSKGVKERPHLSLGQRRGNETHSECKQHHAVFAALYEAQDILQQ